MPLSVRQPPYKIPSYSLTGDLLAYRTCGLQYRYHNRGSLPPSTPVQLWFGEFIHAVMGEAYLRWKQNQQPFPWSWDPTIKEIELDIDRRLRTRGLYAPPNLFDHTGTSQLLASQRAEAAINIWGQHLFPLIAQAEVRLQRIRNMPNLTQGQPRCDYYEITGVVDVITSVELQHAPSGNLILHHLQNNTQIQSLIDTLADDIYEVIVDYKGRRRPGTIVADRSSPNFGQIDPDWEAHEWQILTYSWLRSQQPQSNRVLAGIVLYMNELVPSGQDIEQLQEELNLSPLATDIPPHGPDRQQILSWKRGTAISLSQPFREQRSIRVIPVVLNSVNHSLNNFDSVVREIEDSVLTEMSGAGIINSWRATPQRRNCTACDFKTYCPSSAQPGIPTVP
jgi:hypothetical protein